MRSARGSSGLCTGWPKPGTLAPDALSSHYRHGLAFTLEQLRARLGRPEDHRAGAEDAGRHRAVQRIRVGRERHPRGDVRGHHPVLGDRHQQDVEEEALLLGRLVAGEQ